MRFVIFTGKMAQSHRPCRFKKIMSDQDCIRAFIAVEINSAVRAGLAAAQNALRKAEGRASWVRPQNIHCTLVFLGDIFQSAADALQEILAGAVTGVRPFEIEIAQLGFFGSPRAPRIVWAGIAGETGALIALQEKICGAVLQAGLQPDQKPFKPHLTIGRVRSGRNAAGLLGALAENKNKSFGSFAVESVVLMQSRLGAQGPEYTPLYSAALGGNIVA